MGRSHARDMHDFLQGGRGPRHGDIVAHAAAKEKILLQNHADGSSQMCHVYIADIVIVYPEVAFLQGLQPLEEPGEGAFARS